MKDRATPTDAVEDRPAADLHGVVPEPFEAFYAREIRSLVGLAYVLSGSRSAAEDIAQDGLLAAYHRWEQVSRYESPGGWVRRVVANRSVSVARRALSEGRALVRLGGQRAIVPELSTETEELWSTVRRLPRRQAQVVALHYWNGLTTSAIATVLELSEGSVKTHLQRARRALAATLDLQHDPDRPDAARKD